MYSLSREWVYRDIKPTIFAEELLLDTTTGKPPMDYKFYCFNGTPMFIQVDVDRFSSHKRCFYDLHWNLQSFTTCYPIPDTLPSRPINLHLMVDVAKKLCSDFPFVRIDLYSIPEIKFGEFTFYPEAARNNFSPSSENFSMGSLIDLNNMN